jgi:3-demethoxyubiquinol 3-hydroxylase
LKEQGFILAFNSLVNLTVLEYTVLMQIDKLILSVDNGLRTLFAHNVAARPRPDAQLQEAPLSDASKQHAAALMRINHVGEVCAQALYNGQAFSSPNTNTVKALKQAANEEIDHLAWCEGRIQELGGRKSLLNPLWYAGSFALGAIAGRLDDKWNLGFLAETENQVSAHLQSHLAELDDADAKTRAIVRQMQEDEVKHAATALDLGASQLPAPIIAGMKLASKIMTKTAYHV